MINTTNWFDRFWQAYPNKKAKGAAKKSWDKIAPDDDLAFKIILAIDAQKRWRKRERDSNRFVPEWKHPATWLNQQCWLDEIPSASQVIQQSASRVCNDCDKPAAIYVDQGGYCARHYRNRYLDNRDELYEKCKQIGMQKKADETLPQYYQRCKEWCLGQGYKKVRERF